jgi:hypothetical protein
MGTALAGAKAGIGRQERVHFALLIRVCLRDFEAQALGGFSLLPHPTVRL